MTQLNNEILEPLNDYPQVVLCSPKGLSVSVDIDVPKTEREQLWSMVQAGFMELNRKSFEKQDMTRDELEADFDSSHVMKYVARDIDDTPSGLLTIHVGFDDIVWADTSQLEQIQTDKDPKATAYYVGTLVVPPSLRGTKTAAALVRGAFGHMAGLNTARHVNSLAFFDCAQANYPGIGRYVQMLVTPDADSPDYRATVRELYSESWIQGPEGPTRVRDTPGVPTPGALDVQHYYSIELDAD